MQHYVPEEWAEYPRPIHPAGLQPTKLLEVTSPSPDKDGGTLSSGQELRGNLTGVPGQRLQIQNPLYPVTESSYSAYAVMLLALVVFAVGIVGNLSVMCIVWHSYYLKSAWNSILASLALWDFLVLFFCLPVVIFNEITKQRLLGDVSCRAVPFMEVSVFASEARPWGCNSWKQLDVSLGPGTWVCRSPDPCSSAFPHFSPVLGKVALGEQGGQGMWWCAGPWVQPQPGLQP